MSDFRSKGTALITGASAGIGAVYADRLAKRGYDLILVARNEARLTSLAQRLTSETGRSVKVLRADLGDKAELAQVEATLRHDASITMLVNNAGTASVAPLLNADVDKMEEIIALNVTALTRLDLCRRACVRRAWRRHDHQYRIGGGRLPGNAQWGVWRDQGVCHRLQPLPAA